MAESNGNILFIDDSWVILQRVRAALNAYGYDTSVTSDVDTAASLVPGVELVIVDYRMPVMNGGELLPRLRARVPRGQECQFYLYTSDEEVARHYEDLGFDGSFLRKGDEVVLIAQVQGAFRTIRMRRLASEMRARRLGRS